MNIIKNPKGLTLIEIIVAIAIMGILAVSVSTVFGLSISQIFTSGTRTNEAMEVQTIVDTLLVESDAGRFRSYADIDAHLSSQGYGEVDDESELTVKNGSYDVNYFIDTRNVVIQGETVTGWEVTILQFFDSGERSVQITTFII